MADGVYDRFQSEGFFIVRKDGKLFALSSNCTHRRSKLDAESDHTFYCPRHGSTFSATGKVTEGPATRDLPIFLTSTNENGDLIVKVTT
jgi:cytochrome b6-f complex iron-sulfur subunit